MSIAAEFENSIVDDRMVAERPQDCNSIKDYPFIWITSFPGQEKYTGQMSLCNDERLHWLFSMCSVKDCSVLELGPLECAHTYMLEKIGGAHVDAVEGNKLNFLKCLVIKNIYNLQCKLYLGDLVQYVAECKRNYDIAMASGVLYHMWDPVAFLVSLTKITDTLFFWTHYYSKENPGRASHDVTEYDFNGKKIPLHKQVYEELVNEKLYHGGMRPVSYWMERDSILEVLASQGFTNISIGNDQPDHIHGTAFSVLARRA